MPRRCSPDMDAFIVLASLTLLPMTVAPIIHLDSVSIVSDSPTLLLPAVLCKYWLGTVTPVLSWVFVLIVPARLFQNWYSITNILQASVMMCAQMCASWLFFRYYLLPWHTSQHLVVKLLTKFVLHVTRDLFARINLTVALKMRTPENALPVPINRLSTFVITPMFLVAMYTRLAQISTQSIWTTLSLEVLTSFMEINNLLNILQGKLPGQAALDVINATLAFGMWTASQLPTLRGQIRQGHIHRCDDDDDNGNDISIMRQSDCTAPVSVEGMKAYQAVAGVCRKSARGELDQLQNFHSSEGESSPALCFHSDGEELAKGLTTFVHDAKEEEEEEEEEEEQRDHLEPKEQDFIEVTNGSLLYLEGAGRRVAGEEEEERGANNVLPLEFNPILAASSTDTLHQATTGKNWDEESGSKEEEHVADVEEGKAGNSLENETEQLLVHIVLQIMVADAVSLLQVICMVMVLKLSVAGHFDWEVIVFNISSNLIGEVLVTDLFVISVIAYRCSRDTRQGLYKLKILSMWASTGSDHLLNALCALAPMIMMSPFIMILESAQVETDVSGSWLAIRRPNLGF